MLVHTHIHQTLVSIDKNAWNALNPDGNPFVSYEFLLALERTGCLGKRMGWFPRYFIMSDDNGQIVAASMCYIKNNSHGEFVFDWSWADAYQRSGRHYYPKLVCAAPFTPAQGPRLLVHPNGNTDKLRNTLLKNIIAFCEKQSLSSFHCLFPSAEHYTAFSKHSLLIRKDYQYHWRNRSYNSFDDFIGEFKSRKRKEVRRERRIVADQGIFFTTVHGHEMSDTQWEQAHHFYLQTFLEKGNTPALTLGFFKEIGQTMGDQIVVFFAEKDKQYIAAAICFRSEDTLYGRYWGCDFEYSCLHFEACFYQGIEYCIEYQLQQFEPGAQGEHKITRGFLPTATYSAHWIADNDFRPAIADFLQRERLAMDEYAETLWQKSPFRDGLYQPEKIG